MTKVSQSIGEIIRSCRHARQMSLHQLASQIQKSKSTLAKYETGALNIDVDTLYEIANALHVSVDSLMIPQVAVSAPPQENFRVPDFFSDRKLYVYFWDARNNTLNTSILKIGNQYEAAPNTFNATLYMNINNSNQPYLCENTYIGKIEFHHVLINLTLRHRDTPIENAMIHILDNFTATSTKWGMWSGVSFRPFMPVAVKMLFSRTPLTFDKESIKTLRINKDDIQKMKMYNFFSVTQ